MIIAKEKGNSAASNRKIKVPEIAKKISVSFINAILRVASADVIPQTCLRRCVLTCLRPVKFTLTFLAFFKETAPAVCALKMD